MIYYRYNALTRVLTAEKNYIVTADGATIVNPSEEQYATLRDAYQKGEDAPQPEPQEGKEVAHAGYELDEDHLWHKQWTLVDIPQPTLADFDAAMEEHLRTEREARGYTTREPDSYIASQVPRWAQDARDWVAHRDAVMAYALALINAVESGQRQPPTMAEFKADLPTITWSFTEAS
jgi:hypothetical protein